MRNLSIALGLLVAILLVNGHAVAARPEPTVVGLPAPTPRPTPLVVGITPATPAVTLPPTDTLP